MAGDGSSSVEERVTLPVRTVAALIDRSPTRVRQMLDSEQSPLAGPRSSGRGHERLVWVDSIPELAASPAEVDLQDSLVARLAETDARLADVTTALHLVNVAAEKMREAMLEQDKAFRLMERANRAQRKALKRVREAEQARQDAMAPFTIEDFPARIR